MPAASDRRFPSLRQMVLDTTAARGLAEFYRQPLGYAYRDETNRPGPVSPTRGFTTCLSSAVPAALRAFQR